MNPPTKIDWLGRDNNFQISANADQALSRMAAITACRASVSTGPLSRMTAPRTSISMEESEGAKTDPVPLSATVITGTK